jgi:hypothetical protein
VPSAGKQRELTPAGLKFFSFLFGLFLLIYLKMGVLEGLKNAGTFLSPVK